MICVRHFVAYLPVDGWQWQKPPLLDQVAHLGGAEVAHEPDLDVLVVDAAVPLALGQVDAAQEGLVRTPRLLRAHVVGSGLLHHLVVLERELD